MKKFLLLLTIAGISTASVAQNVGIGNTSFTPNASAILELRSTSSGFLLPKMTEAQKDAILNPAAGVIIYQTNGVKGFKYFNGTIWTEFGGAADNFGTHIAETNIQLDDYWISNDGDAEGIRVNDNGNVGIGTATPDRMLNVGGGQGAQILLTREDGNTNVGEALGELIFDSSDDTSPSITDGSAVIRATASENHGNSNKGGNLHFLTKQTGSGMATAAIERMTISHNGNIGIGTSTPTAKFHTKGSVRLEGLAGTDTRMVVADNNGNLSTQDLTSAVVGVLDEVTRAVSGSSTQSTSSSSYSDLSQMSLSVEPGRYIFQFNADMQVNNGNTIGEFSFNVLGSTVTNSVRKIKPGTNSPGIVTLITVVDVTGTGTVKVQFRRNSGSGTVTVGGRTLMAMRISE